MECIGASIGGSGGAWWWWWKRLKDCIGGEVGLSLTITRRMGGVYQGLMGLSPPMKPGQWENDICK